MICTTIDIWKDLPYTHAGEEAFRPLLHSYVLDLTHRETAEDGIRPRPAVLVLPGGGYRMTSPREGEPIALQFTAAGIHAFVLHYSVAPNRHPQPLRDASRAMNIIRERAGEWNVDPGRIAVCGFSAGGHLTASLGVHWDKEFLQGVPGLEPGRNRPDGLILGYPVISSGEHGHAGSFGNLLGDVASDDMLRFMSLELQVGDHTPPAFLWHTFDDAAVPVANSLLFAEALRAQGIPFELHVYPEGPHGLALATEETANNPEQVVPRTQSWISQASSWVKEYV
jgi:acetyl esterase/lipase